MARTKNDQRSANRVAVDVGATGTEPVSKTAVLTLGVCIVAILWAVAMMTPPGRVGYYYFFIYAEYYMGVLTLVSLSITIMVGLVATDRLVLSIRQRVMLQSTHRTTGVIAVSSLVAHVWTKIAEGTIGIVDAFLPFLAGGDNKVFIGLGTLSGWIMIFVMWTGIARSRFIGRGRPWMWRGIHATSYLMWPIALVHGLSAGRQAATWVVVSYIVCILLVLVGLAVRLSVSFNRRKDFSSAAGVGAGRPGAVVPTGAPIAAKRERGGRRTVEPEPVAQVNSFSPAAQMAPPVEVAPIEQTAPPVSAMPASAMPSSGAPFADDLVVPRGSDEPTRSMRREYDEDDYPARAPRSLPLDEIEYDEPAPRARRYELDDTSTRMRRADLEDTGVRRRGLAPEDTSTRMRRSDLGGTSTRLRRLDPDEMPRQRRRDDEPAPRSHGWEDDYEPAAPRGRRRADADGYGRSAGWTEEEDAPRGRRGGVDRADSGRHSRTEFVRFDEVEGDETPTLVDMASRRARRAEQPDRYADDRVQAGRGSRRGRGGRDDDAEYWSQLRGEAN